MSTFLSFSKYFNYGKRKKIEIAIKWHENTRYWGGYVCVLKYNLSVFFCCFYWINNAESERIGSNLEKRKVGDPQKSELLKKKCTLTYSLTALSIDKFLFLHILMWLISANLYICHRKVF